MQARFSKSERWRSLSNGWQAKALSLARTLLMHVKQQASSHMKIAHSGLYIYRLQGKALSCVLATSAVAVATVRQRRDGG
jgi:hypothetical protein